FEIGIDDSTDFGFFLGLDGIVAKVSVAYEAILQAEGVNRFREARGERNDAGGRNRDMHGPPHLIDNVARGGLRRRYSRGGLCGHIKRAEQEKGEQQGRETWHEDGIDALHDSPLTRVRESRKQKSPTRIGARDPVFSLAKNTQPLQLGRTAWLTAALTITVAGPMAIFTALPHFPSLQVGKTVYGARPGVSMEVEKFSCEEISGFSSWAC